MSDPQIHRPFEKAVPDLEGVPAEEGISEADAVERLDEDPEEQENFTERHGRRTQVDQPEPDDPASTPETGPDREESIALDAPEHDDA